MQEKTSKKRGISKLKNVLCCPVANASPLKSLSLIPNDSCRGQRRLSYSYSTESTANSLLNISPIKKSRSSSTLPTSEEATETNAAKLQQELVQYQAMHEQLLQEAKESMDETEYLQNELEVTCQKLHASLLDADRLGMKLQHCTKRLNSTEQQLKQTQNVLRQLLEMSDGVNDDLLALANETLCPETNNQLEDETSSVIPLVMGKRFSGHLKRQSALVVCVLLLLFLVLITGGKEIPYFRPL